MTDAILVALVVAILGPVILNVLNARARHKEKLEDWARQDEVAEKLLRANEVVALQSRDTQKKLEVIHTLVNSNMTAAMDAELHATEREYAMMLEVIDLKKTAGVEPTRTVLDQVAATEAKIAELRATMEDRLNQATANLLNHGQ